MKPTKEQIAETRQRVASLRALIDMQIVQSAKLELDDVRRLNDLKTLAHAVASDVDVLLATTEEPDDEELAEEAARYACSATGQAPEDWDPQHVRDAVDGAPSGPWNDAARAYLAGARREGRR